MRIAFSAEGKNGLDSPVSHHFGRCACYILVDLEGEQVQGVQAVDNPYYAQHEPGMVPGFINGLDVDVMVSGGMGRRAIDFFQQYGIQVATGAAGTIGIALESFLKGELQGASPCKDTEGGHEHCSE